MREINFPTTSRVRYKKLGIKKRSDVNERAFLIPNFLKNYLKCIESARSL